MDTRLRKDDNDDGGPGPGGSGAGSGVASGGSSKKTSVRGEIVARAEVTVSVLERN